MIPLRDDNPTTLTPFVTIGLIVLNCLVFFYQVSLGPKEEEFVLSLAAIPADVFHQRPMVGNPLVPPWLTVFTSMFLHANILHLGGNMLYLWIFGNNIEDVMGHGRFVLFFLLVGGMAAFTHAVVAPSSTLPMIGASGAISGVMGAYFVLYPTARVDVLFLFFLLPVPAVFLIGFWFALQLFSGVATFGTAQGASEGVAVWAHVGGFVTGLVIVLALRPFIHISPLRRRSGGS